MTRLGFVQADPIRSPARAQDLILRHRVKGYRAGDLERSYPELGLEECYLFAYGFLSKELWRVIHPKTNERLTSAQKKALELIEQHGPMHPKELEIHVGKERVRNYWGGFSRTAKFTMEELHDRGALRIARRDKGIRIYETAEGFEQTLSNEERFKEIAVAALKAMGPTTRRFLLSELSHFGNLAKNAGMRRKCLQELIGAGRVRVDLVDEVEYISLDGQNGRRRKSDGVRILAPFDPIVRDRTRFEHLWGWTYRFEAYTPKAKRKLGYYAMPVLWREQIIGWANASVEDSRLKVDFGYNTKRPDERKYQEATELEVARLAKFLGLKESDWEASI
ncbi:DNA glycosylase AlkZ-like family protein [Rubellicoccus peritrichatus]|uniref:Crosslink repair DNA glycosylase YcaQ family protein n=1 Tax=Rubellicoccus peritrichatus TaxID=3080537 RepID=A0AAQ3L828_9BACT|nr:crosslink repair DNA glycosylase YcaQ family protein [Puniceicoccus sp. CR14]WOO40791.1 crosslink repair DNA glycosylase YcaQ family protein [Puniceicoccus sp. CR14]